ncbi:hypothetical protein AVEN_244919-1 [Araneus ventricosus]|uniref:Uncharacterized protein n=1 Tax=Araneus ventricosus TaxID=182803 RepID=A0A4Y1ZZ35_ARAVE|nr:hypothetical protein AVEN_46825-1 [Araneus ventricosus]GBL72058.1 hypothetical protein AVEN_66438-1 [Araneus ventricosus]GBL72065.1 hypothetical protein AVEN_79362-1 [Araneus ventricosus]GBL72104.1 hypothetical protein AVEN_244919-1 [Araneus ventricosus]
MKDLSQTRATSRREKGSAWTECLSSSKSDVHLKISRLPWKMSTDKFWMSPVDLSCGEMTDGTISVRVRDRSSVHLVPAVHQPPISLPLRDVPEEQESEEDPAFCPLAVLLTKHYLEIVRPLYASATNFSPQSWWLFEIFLVSLQAEHKCGLVSLGNPAERQPTPNIDAKSNLPRVIPRCTKVDLS